MNVLFSLRLRTWNFRVKNLDCSGFFSFSKNDLEINVITEFSKELYFVAEVFQEENQHFYTLIVSEYCHLAS